MKRPSPRPVGDLLAGALPGLDERLTAHGLRRGWAGLVGPEVARRAQPQALTGGCLQIRVDNSPWLHELTLRGAELLERIRRDVPAVASLRFVLGPLEPPAAVPRERRIPRRPLDPAAAQAIEAAATVIADPGAAAAARRLLATAWRSPNSRGALE